LIEAVHDVDQERRGTFRTGKIGLAEGLICPDGRHLCGEDYRNPSQTLLLHGELAHAEPKKLRYRLVRVAARITRNARRTRLRIATHWHWATDLVTAFTRLATLPRPAS
jgi:hypothetical protein